MKIDSISDLATKIRNGLIQKKLTIKHFASYDNLCILDILHLEGFIHGYRFESVEDVEKKKEKKKQITIFLKYHNYKPAIKEIKRISTPGKRIYTNLKELKDKKKKHLYSFNEHNNNELSIYILSTNLGIMTDRQARHINEGGEILLKVS